MLHLLIRKGVSTICKQVARHDGAAVADAALVQLRELQGRRGQRLEGTLYLCTRQEGLHRASRPHAEPHMGLVSCTPASIHTRCSALSYSHAEGHQHSEQPRQEVPHYEALTLSVAKEQDGLTCRDGVSPGRLAMGPAGPSSPIDLPGWPPW